MGLNSIVLVKQVPDTQNITGQAMKPDGPVNRDALPAIFNPEDLNALEMALQIRERVGGTVTAVTMGPPKAEEVLRECLYRGADDVVLVSDRAFAGADTLATSYALKCTIERLQPFDLVLGGRQAIDGDTAQVGPQVAEKLGLNQVTGVSELLEVEESQMTVRRVIENGTEVLRARLPLLVTTTSEANVPRSPSAKLVMAYKKLACMDDDAYDESYIEGECAMAVSHIRKWNVDSIRADLERCGLSGSATKVKKIENVVLTAREMKQVDNSDEGIRGLVKELIGEHILG